MCEYQLELLSYTSMCIMRMVHALEHFIRLLPVHVYVYQKRFNGMCDATSYCSTGTGKGQLVLSALSVLSAKLLLLPAVPMLLLAAPYLVPIPILSLRLIDAPLPVPT